MIYIKNIYFIYVYYRDTITLSKYKKLKIGEVLYYEQQAEINQNHQYKWEGV